MLPRDVFKALQTVSQAFLDSSAANVIAAMRTGADTARRPRTGSSPHGHHG
jgi:hypothetical protein